MASARQSEDIIHQMIDAWRRLDLDAVMSLLSEDAVFLPDPGGEPVRGREAIGALWTYYMGLFASYECEVHHLLSSDRLVLVEKTERIARVDGQQVVLPVASVFELNGSGKIVAWRDYWDPAMANG